jgi:hypothetical protein
VRLPARTIASIPPLGAGFTGHLNRSCFPSQALAHVTRGLSWQAFRRLRTLAQAAVLTPDKNGRMAQVRANLLDEDDTVLNTLELDSDEEFSLNGWFKSPDGGVYVVCELKAGDPPVDVAFAARWLDGPSPKCPERSFDSGVAGPRSTPSDSRSPGVLLQS